ncbi:MAG TPA: membrane dipeptidase [Steroidobacteraceae bacterium]|nr:membrane dipeptidase [Steroidobacteraceae bacterium]
MTGSTSRRSFLLTTAMWSAAGLLPLRLARAASWTGYDAAIVIDGVGGPGNSAFNAGVPLPEAALEDVRHSGLTALNLTILPVGTTPPDSAFAQAVQGILYWESEIDRVPQVLARIRSVADIAAAKKAGRTGLIYGFQDGVAFETDLSRLSDFYRLGVRIIQPTYNRRNLLGDGCLETADAGLSKAGIEAITRMNDLGILVDLSHCGRRTASDAIQASKRPVAFTHTGCAALSDHPRNRTDAELRAVADKGGVSGIYFMPYLNNGHQPTAANVIAHLEHAIEVAGEDHVSIGTDGGISPETIDDAFRRNFAENIRARREAGIAAPGETEDGYLFASDLNSARRFETLATMLSSRGHSGARIEKILGRNLLRVFSDVWKP